MRHIDITFDFETCSTAPDAAPMQLGAIVWDRYADGGDPFLSDTFTAGIDLRSCVMAGLTFDQSTVDWWSRQDELAKLNVLECEPEPVDTVYHRFIKWIFEMQKKYQAETVCLWCQGQDFDFPILKSIARKFGVLIGVHQHYFRDCRTFVLETAILMCDKAGGVYELANGERLTSDIIRVKPMRAYDIIPKVTGPILDGRTQHDALYDCLRSSWSVWQCMKLLRQ